MKWVLLLGIAVGGVAHANEGVTKVREACRYVGTSDSVNACLKTMKDADYVDSTAVDVCRYIGTSEKIISCFKAVRDRHYEDSEINTCRYVGGSDKIITCLENTGRRKRRSSRAESHDDEVDEPRVRLSFGSNSGSRGDAGLRKTLKRALEAVRSGDSARAEALLEAAIDSTR